MEPPQEIDPLRRSARVLLRTGPVVPVRGCDPSSDVHLRVERAYRGAEAGEIVVLNTGNPDTSCSFDYREVETWLLVGRKGGTSYSTGSKRIPRDDELLNEVAEILAGTDPT